MGILPDTYISTCRFGCYHSLLIEAVGNRTSPPASAEEESKNMLPTYYIYFQIHQYKLPIHLHLPN